MKIILCAIIAIHGLIHLPGFIKAFKLARIDQLNQPISKINGVLWLITAIIFVLAAVVFALQKEWWWMISASGMLVSQYLIIQAWKDAKFGSIANGIILIITIIGFGVWCLKK